MLVYCILDTMYKQLQYNFTVKGSSEEREKHMTDFIKKYGKPRVCKFYENEWKKREPLSDPEAEVQEVCKDDKQGEQELIDILKKGFKAERESRKTK